MTDIVPEPISPPLAEVPAPGRGAAPEAPRHAWRLVKSPLLRVSATIAGLALGWGAFHAANNLWASRHNNTPVSSSSHAPSGALTVTGHGVTLTFPAGWVNVPTTPNKLAQFMQANAPVITVTTPGAADAAATLRQIASSIKFG